MADSAITLRTLNSEIKKLLKSNFNLPFWVIAEISEIKVNYSGHCYIELIEKDSDTGELTAKAKGIIWAYTFRMLKPYFETTTGQTLSSGLKIMIQAEVEFHETYGYSLIIKDINPTFTIGEIEKRRQDIIKRLINEGVMNMNKELEFPLLPKTIAVISSENAAGYGDFVNQLHNNTQGYKFHTRLFNASMQGEDVEKSIIAAFDKIYEKAELFDVVVIIRGGGSKTDLSWFDNYNIAYHITQFPLPILTGIGHEQDDTIADMVAWKKLKTPTAVAEFLIDAFSEFEETIHEYESFLLNYFRDTVNNEKSTLEYFGEKIQMNTRVFVERQNSFLQSLTSEAVFNTRGLIKNNRTNLLMARKEILKSLAYAFRKESEKQKNLFLLIQLILKNNLAKNKTELGHFEKDIEHLDPKKVLERGYSITFFNNKAIKNSRELKPNVKIITVLHDGKIESVVAKTD